MRLLQSTVMRTTH